MNTDLHDNEESISVSGLALQCDCKRNLNKEKNLKSRLISLEKCISVSKRYITLTYSQKIKRFKL